jgi:hypothetical protein
MLENKHKAPKGWRPLKKQDLEANYWINEKVFRKIRPSSRPVYLTALRKFFNWAKKTPDELVEIWDDELKKPIKDRNFTPGLIYDYRDMLECRRRLSPDYEVDGVGKPAPKTIRLYDSAVRGFYSIIFNRDSRPKVIEYEYGDIVKNPDVRLTLEDIAAMLDVVDLDEGLRIIWQPQTGMREGDMLALKLGGCATNKNILRDLERGKNPLPIHYLPEKDRTKIGWRITCLGSDGIEMLKKYIKKHALGPDDYIFFSMRPYDKSKPLSKEALRETIRRAAVEAGIVEEGNEVVRPHGMRDFFQSTFETAGHEATADFCMGHKPKGTRKAYLNLTEEEVREIYSKVEHRLNPITGRNGGHAGLKREMSAHMQDFASTLMRMWGASDPEGFKRMAEEILGTKFSIKYDETKDFKPAVYILQDAAKEILKEITGGKHVEDVSAAGTVSAEAD